MKIISFKPDLAEIDACCDYIPLVSTITNIVDLLQKFIFMQCMTTEQIEGSKYYTHLRDKSAFDCFILLIPVVGNIFVYIFRDSSLAKSKFFERANEVFYIDEQKDCFNMLSPEQKSRFSENVEFMRKVIKTRIDLNRNPEWIGILKDSNIVNNEEFMLDLLENKKDDFKALIDVSKLQDDPNFIAKIRSQHLDIRERIMRNKQLCKSVDFARTIIPQTPRLYLSEDEVYTNICYLDYRQIQDDKDVLRRLKNEKDRSKEFMTSQEDSEKFQYIRYQSKNFQEEKLQSTTSANPVSIGSYQASVCSIQGKRKGMEDEHLAAEFTLQIGEQNYPVQLFAVFDGHGGAQVASYLKENFQACLQKELLAKNEAGLSTTGIWNALKLVFVRFQENLPKGIKTTIGSTATVAMILNDQIWTANLGDSRTLLHNGAELIPLSRDAHPTDGVPASTAILWDQEGEWQKKVKSHGFANSVVKRNGFISCQSRIGGALGVARAVGDISITGMDYRAKVTVHSLEDLKKQNSYLLLHCDGISEVCSSTQLSPFILGDFKNGVGLEQVIQNVVYSAYASGSEDNITGMIIRYDSSLENQIT